MKNEADVKKWLQYSEDDSKIAQYLYNNMTCEIICFHCQQAAEKLIKGLLVAKGISFAKKHDLLYLVTL
ncbi:MAG: HEPN domain-containing protein [Clostridia bacterium]|nr:HEPN domain-containing protein [Clostridia bacterium]